MLVKNFTLYNRLYKSKNKILIPNKFKPENVDKYFSNKYSKLTFRRMNKIRFDYFNDEINHNVNNVDNIVYNISKICNSIDFVDFIDIKKEILNKIKNKNLKYENKLTKFELIISMWHLLNKDKNKFKYLYNELINGFRLQLYRNYTKEYFECYQNIDNSVRRKFLDSIKKDYEPKIYDLYKVEDLIKN